MFILVNNITKEISKLFLVTSLTINEFIQNKDKESKQQIEEYLMILNDSRNVLKEKIEKDIEKELDNIEIGAFDTYHEGFILLTINRPLSRTEQGVINNYFGTMGIESEEGTVNNIHGFISKWTYDDTWLEM
ncbi:MAG: hypothetical protein FWH54_02905 [Methanobrevibacter sp.]|nr:hypothetical protein [Methanobrevibacter sp.]